MNTLIFDLGIMEARVFVVIFALVLGHVTDPLFDAEQGYRIARYRAVVPQPPEGVPRITGEQALSAWRSRKAILIDVTPAEGAVRDPVTGTWRLAQSHAGIPGSHWFPEAGRGVPDDGIAAWFMAGVERQRRARPHAPLIVYCLADCWMSWNAALRLRRAGYRDVRWYADGLDGWRERGLPMVNLMPDRPIAPRRKAGVRRGKPG